MSAPPLTSRLPDVGVSIFSVMSAAATAHNAINLAQGFPSFEPPEALRSRVRFHLDAGHNQYAPMGGIPALTEAIQKQLDRNQRRSVDAATEVTVSAGATEALFCAIQAALAPGDEAILLDPAYDSYAPVVRLAGATPVHIPMHVTKVGEFSVDWQRLEDAISDRTALIVINFPHNPSGALLDRDDLDRLAALLRPTRAFLIADEVYEHIVFGNQRHLSVAAHDELWERAWVISSFGKSLHATGWKVGYCVAPQRLTEEFRKVHQFANFSVSTPMQHAIADYITENPDFADQLSAFYEAKRDCLLAALDGSGFRYVPARSTFFQLVDYSELSDANDSDLAMLWTETAGVASIPVSVFCQHGLDASLLRLCFAKDDTTLIAASERLKSIKK